MEWQVGDCGTGGHRGDLVGACWRENLREAFNIGFGGTVPLCTWDLVLRGCFGWRDKVGCLLSGVGANHIIWEDILENSSKKITWAGKGFRVGILGGLAKISAAARQTKEKEKTSGAAALGNWGGAFGRNSNELKLKVKQS